MGNFAQNAPLITDLHDSALVLPGLTSEYQGESITEKYSVATGAFLFPGLLAVRRGNLALEAQDFNQLGTPAENDIIGVVALPRRAFASGRGCIERLAPQDLRTSTSSPD